MKNIVLLFVIILSSCKSKDCASMNYKLIDEFESKLAIVKKAQKKEIKVVEYREAITYLSITSGIMTLAEYSDTIGFKNAGDYKHDMKLWREWLDKNHCMAVSAKE